MLTFGGRCHQNGYICRSIDDVTRVIPTRIRLAPSLAFDAPEQKCAHIAQGRESEIDIVSMCGWCNEGSHKGGEGVDCAGWVGRRLSHLVPWCGGACGGGRRRRDERRPIIQSQNKQIVRSHSSDVRKH